MELENFGRYLFDLFKIQDVTPDWKGIIHGYKTQKLGSKKYGRPYINYTTAKKFGIDAGMLLVRCQKDEIVMPRSTAEYMMWLCGYSHGDIAEYYNKAACTVSENIRMIMTQYKTNRQMKEKINELKIELL